MMRNDKLEGRDLFEAELRKSSAMPRHNEEYAILALQRNPDNRYSTTWVRAAWMGWQMAIAQPAQPASAGSIGDDAEFQGFIGGLVNAEYDNYMEYMAKLVAYIDSRPRQADQQASAGELPPLPKDCGMLLPQRTVVYNAGQMRAYALAAIALQAPDTVRDDALDALQSIANGIPNPVKFAELSIRAMKSTAPKLADGEGE